MTLNDYDMSATSFPFFLMFTPTFLFCAIPCLLIMVGLVFAMNFSKKKTLSYLPLCRPLSGQLHQEKKSFGRSAARPFCPLFLFFSPFPPFWPDSRAHYFFNTWYLLSRG
jgi:hypothetical protein